MEEAQDFRGVVERTDTEPIETGSPTEIRIYAKEKTRKSTS